MNGVRLSDSEYVGTSGTDITLNHAASEGDILDVVRFDFGNALRGLQGVQGVQGVQGNLGIQGVQGLDGQYAAQGIQGPQGTTGTQGLDGTQGIDGTQGVQGTQGIQGDIGLQGVSGRGVTILGSVATSTSLPGYPTSYVGNVGDGYITTDTGRLWTWNGSSWDDVGNITGPQGTQGIQGLRGLQGIQGPQGTTGVQGSFGVQGVLGLQGIQGIQGPQGTTGIQGLDGIQGIQGIQGTEGRGALQNVTAVTTGTTYYPLFVLGSGDQTPNIRTTATAFSYDAEANTVTATNFNSTSDINLKTDVEVIQNSLQSISKIKGVSFSWKSNGKKSLGVIAQEVEAQYPELVTELNGEKTLNYNGLVGVLIEAVKELQEKVDNLNSSTK